MNRRRMLTVTAAGAAVAAASSTARAAAVTGSSVSALQDVLTFGPGVPSVAPSGPAVRRVVTQARDRLEAGAYQELVTVLPEQLALATAWQQRGRGAGEVATLWALAARVAIKSGDELLLSAAADRAVRAAVDDDVPLVLAEARRMVSSAYRRAGRHERALQIAVRTADELCTARETSRAARDVARGQVLATAGYTAAKLGDGSQAYELLKAARGCAEQVSGEHAGAGGWFGMRQIRGHEVSVRQVLGEPSAAISAARGIDLRGMPAERAARLWLDVARAYEEWGRLRETFEALQRLGARGAAGVDAAKRAAPRSGGASP